MGEVNCRNCSKGLLEEYQVKIAEYIQQKDEEKNEENKLYESSFQIEHLNNIYTTKVEENNEENSENYDNIKLRNQNLSVGLYCDMNNNNKYNQTFQKDGVSDNLLNNYTNQSQQINNNDLKNLNICNNSNLNENNSIFPNQFTCQNNNKSTLLKNHPNQYSNNSNNLSDLHSYRNNTDININAQLNDNKNNEIFNFSNSNQNEQHENNQNKENDNDDQEDENNYDYNEENNEENNNDNAKSVNQNNNYNNELETNSNNDGSRFEVNNRNREDSFSSSDSHRSVHSKIRRVGTLKFNKRKMPLEVIDEINGEIYNKDKNVYNIMTNPNQQYKYCKTAGMKYESGDSNKKQKIINRHKNWREININSVLPIEKLMNVKENDILIQGEFIVFTKENDLKNIENTSKFLIFNRSEIKIYRSKELLLHRKNPLKRVPLFNITQCDIIKYKKIIKIIKNIKNLEKYNFEIVYTSVNGMKIEDNLETNGKVENKEAKPTKNISNKENKNSDFVMINAKRMKLIPEGKVEPVSHKPNTLYNMNESRYKRLIYFSSKDEDLILRWVRVINYFLAK